jgi:F0F1-type ATP synthase assembly protein I
MSRKNKKTTPSGANFLGLSFQTGILILLGVLGGRELDKFIGTKPLFIILFSLITIAFSMYYIIHKATPKKKQQ